MVELTPAGKVVLERCEKDFSGAGGAKEINASHSYCS
jgi:hypothetical protein